MGDFLPYDGLWPLSKKESSRGQKVEAEYSRAAGGCVACRSSLLHSAACGIVGFVMQRNRGIILAADVTTLAELRTLAELVSTVEEVAAIKVGFSLALRHGLPAVVSAVNAVARLSVIYDHQKAGTDIPRMGKPFALACRDAGAQGVIFFPQAGPKTLEGFVSAAFECELTPIVGLVMTHQAYLQSEGGYLADDAPESMCKTAVGLGVTSFVLPGTKPDVIKRFATGPLDIVKPATIMTPGIGSQGGSLRSALEAAGQHRYFAIIGSAIYAAADPKTALESFAQEIRA